MANGGMNGAPGSPYRFDVMHNAERSGSGPMQMAVGGPGDHDDIAGSSDEEGSGQPHKPSNKSSGSAARGKKRAAPSATYMSGKSSASANPASETGAATPDDGQNDGQKRKKKAVSCEGCRRRKLKCDRGWPCGACRDRDESHLCSWEGGTRPQGPGRDQDNVPLIARMDKMETLLTQIAGHIGLNGTKPVAISNPVAVAGPSTSTANQVAPAAVKPPGEPSFASPITRGKMNVSLLGAGCFPTTESEAMSELCEIMKILPDTQALRRMCSYYFDQLGWMQYAVEEDDFWQQLRGHEELRMMSSGSLLQSRLVNKDNVRHHLQFLALLLSICALADLLSNEPDFSDVAKEVGVSPLYPLFFDASQRALNASNPFEDPTLCSLRVLMLLCWGLASVRGLSASVALLSLSVNQMYALGLDVEPPPSMQKAKARDRIRLFHTLVTMDWLGAGTMKKSYLIREEPVKHPLMFGRQNIKDGLSDKDGVMLPDMWLKLELARINRRAVDRTAMNEEDAYHATLTLQQELDEVFSDLPQDFEAELFVDRTEFDIAPLHRLAVLMMVANQLINLHKRYYIQGWLDPVYRTSRDICFSSARRTCLITRKMFNFIVPVDKLMAMDLDQVNKVMDGKQSLSARLWFFAHSSVGACLLLQHHYALMEVHPDAAGPNAEKVRKEIIDDLRITRRVLMAMSARSQVAKSGMDVLARPELTCSGGAQANEYPHPYSEGQRAVESEEDLTTRADLTKDLQSITDHDTFATKRFKVSASDSTLSYRGRRQHRASHSNDGPSQIITPRSTSGTPTSASQSIQGFPHGGQQPQQYRAGSVNGGQAELGRPTTQFAMPGQPHMQQKQPQQGAWPNHNMPLSEMEALLESALSTDLNTGLPLPPEASFERQADRIGGTPFAISTGAGLGSGPMSPFTSAFLGTWDFQSTQSAAPATGTTGNPMGVPSAVTATTGNTSSNWY
jgi:hypothetical protein